MTFFQFSFSRGWRAGTALVVTAVALRAQQPGAAALTLTQALAQAAERNPSLATGAFQGRAAEAMIEQAGLRPNPTIGFEAENFVGTGALRGVRGLETTVQASQTFERGGKREKRVAVATRERETAAGEFHVRRAEVLALTAAAFVNALIVQQRLALAAEPLRLGREIAELAERRVRDGVTSRAESARARAGLASVQAERARAQLEFDLARTKLAATWGGSAGDITAIAGSLQVPDALPSDTTVAAKIAEHPRLALQRAIIAGRRATLELEQAQATQDVTVGGGVRFLREGSDAGFVAGVSVPLPVRNRNQGSIRAARETLAGAEHTVKAIESELRSTFAGAWQELSAAHAVVVTLRREVLPATEDAHAIVRRAYAEGQLPLTDVLDAQRALVTVRREIFEAEASYALAHTRAEAIADATFPATITLLSSR